MDRYLLVTIDSEEDMPRWRPEIKSTTKNINALPELHEFLTRHEVQPTYLVNQPVLAHDDSLKIIKRLANRGGCEIGAHLHSWNTPPLSETEKHGAATYLSGQDKAAKRAKLTQFTDLFQEKLGFRPSSYRAGRYGLCPDCVEILTDLRYQVDSSIAPLMDFRADGGPDYRSFDAHPFWFAQKNGGGKIMEVPVSIALVHRFPSQFQKLYFQIPNWTKLKGGMHRLNLARLLWLRPTTYSVREMRQLADHLLDNSGVPVLNIMFHSSEVYPGASPYNKTPNDVVMFYERLKEILRYLVGKRFLKSVTLSGFANICSSSRLNVRAISIHDDVCRTF